MSDGKGEKIDEPKEMQPNEATKSGKAQSG